ncbi:hypothetical protein Sme01_54500 [Sphaerisporangium melleum]|uniref:HTH cro/C1-type domain-containing protein n=1 Tax=Sphaerisporangium melleum TaxID=321316 RepID=A0A917R6M2_9ACTN|nr:helix-turn-helix transcriptional regulator [Sphaerisporangium melleum]GGK92071.1 hypothetical protein GCM10007964_38360 [Sphaerisporangium melleum]GII72974.1 hypothetical protein Sme01_54500 [Sphaerisporangium melleum]
MPEAGTLGRQIRKLRKEQDVTQEQLAERAGVSVDLIKKLEQGGRNDIRASYLMRIAAALDTEMSVLIGKRPRISGRADGSSVLALRDVLLDRSLLPGFSRDDDGVPAPAAAVDDTVSAAWRLYWAGDFAELTARIPGLVGEARLARLPHALAQAYQLAACLLVHFGSDNLATLAAERALASAADGDDELHWATLHGTYAWTLLHQGRPRESEDLAVRMAERIEPTFTSPPQHLVVWGGLLLTAMAAAVADARTAAAEEYISLASAAAARITGGDRHDYQVSFGPTQVAMQTTHAYTMLREPGRALKAAAGVTRGDLFPISYGRHLLDKAHAQADAGYGRAAATTLTDAAALSPVWFRHQGPARSLVERLREEETKLSTDLRRLVKLTGVDR